MFCSILISSAVGRQSNSLTELRYCDRNWDGRVRVNGCFFTGTKCVAVLATIHFIVFNPFGGGVLFSSAVDNNII
jgi:hypothetical protein